jgi:uncharacterized integral membrane protein (TIGR00698 family)
MQISWKKNYRGLLFCLAIGLCGLGIGNYLPSLGGITIAIFIGLLWGNIFPSTTSLKPGIQFAEKNILSLAIMLLGLELHFEKLKVIDLSVMIIMISSILLVILTTLVVGHFLKLPYSLSLLLGIGNAICGSSAIIASSYLVTDKRDEVGLSIGTIQVLGSITLLSLPFLSIWFSHYSNDFAGILIGGSLQAVGHVVAASHILNPESAELAITVKMGRVLCLVPLIMILSFFRPLKKSTKTNGKSASETIPGFIVGFILCAIIGNLGIFPQEYLLPMKHLNHLLLATAMAALGLNIHLTSLKKQAPKSLFIGLFVFTLQVFFLSYCLHSYL